MKRRGSPRMRIIGFGVVISEFLSMASLCSGVQDVWTQRADMPTPRWGHTSAVVNGKIYVIGGGSSETDFRYLSSVEEYDPLADTWAKKADMPTARGWTSPSSAVVRGRIYVIGGDRGSPLLCLPIVEEYDPSTDTWTRKADMPTPRWGLATCTVNGKIYAIGGYPPKGYVGLTTVEVYDPATDSWSQKADMPLGVALLNANVVRGKIYAVGGRPDVKARAYVQEYDPATDTWTRKADMLVGTSQMVSVVLADKIVVIGGWLWSGDPPYQAVQVYDPETDRWTREADTPFLRAVFSADVVDNRIYVIGGTDRPHPCPATATVYEPAHGPPPDFNADGSVDIQDLLTLIESWGQDDPVADIAPAFADGVVDALDLEFLMGYWGQELDDPTLVAHWALDETEGIVAHDRAGTNHGTIVGLPQWRPQGGRIDGALELNGTTLVTAKSPLSPAAGPFFSVLAWVKGGRPGQVIVAQLGGANWLMANTATGALTTELSKSVQAGGGLSSQAIITDGNWHRIAFTWDGANRRLYMDGVLVAEDAQDSLAGSSGNLVIGAGKTMAPTTFWKGLIDDVRIYDRVVRP